MSTTSITNLSVQTIDQAGQQRLYNFNIHHVAQPQYVGVVLSPYQVRQQQVSLQPNLRLDSLDPDTIERGLAVAMAQRYTPTDDPIVAAVRKMLTMVRRDCMTLTQAAQLAQVSKAVLVALNALGKQSSQSTSSVVMTD